MYPALEGGEYQQASAPSVVRDRQIPNGAGSGEPALQVMSARLIYRSAGACPPRRYDEPKHGEGQALALRTARNTHPHRSAGACPPRRYDDPRHGEGNPLACACGNLRGPKPYVKGRRFFHRDIERFMKHPHIKGET